MSTFTNITVEDYTNHKSDGKKLKKLQEHVPELQGRINSLAEEYRRELAVEKDRAEAAELALSQAVSAEQTRALGVEGVLRTDLDAEVVNRVADVAAEKTRAEAAELVLSQSVSAEETRALGVEGVLRTDLDALVTQQSSDKSAIDLVTSAITVSSGLASDGTWVPHTDTNHINNTANAKTAREALDTELGYVNTMLGPHAGQDGQFTVSIGAINAKTYSIDAEGVESYSTAGLTVKQAAINLSGAIDREKARALAAEASAVSVSAAADAIALADRRQIKDDFAFADGAATTDRGRIRTELASAVGAEQSRAIAVEGVLRSDLTAETAARIAADGIATTDRATIRTELSAAVAVEDARAKAAEAALSTRVDNILNNSDPAQIDSLSEMLTAFQTADGNLTNTIAALTTKHDAEKIELEGLIASSVLTEKEAQDASRATLKSELESADDAIVSKALDMYDSFDRKEYAYDSTISSFSGASAHVVDTQLMKWEPNFNKDPDAPVSMGFLGQKRTVKIAGKLFCPAGYKLKIYYDDVSSQVAFEELEFGVAVDNQFEHCCEFYFGSSLSLAGKVPVAMSDKFKTYANTMQEVWGQMADLEFGLTANRMVFRVRYEFVLDGSVEFPVGNPSFTVYAREQTIDHYANKHPDSIVYFENQ